MAASGELQKIHNSCDEIEKAVETSYIKTMDLLNVIEHQIHQAEKDIYEELQTNELMHDIKTLGDQIKFNDCYVMSNNFELAKKHLGSDPIVARLQGLIRAKVELLQTKIDIQSDYVHRIIGEDAAAVDELQNFTDIHKHLEGLAGPTDNLQGDAKLLFDQIESARHKEVNQFHTLCDDHCNAFERRAMVYKDMADDKVRDNINYKFDAFKTELLKHLA